MTDQLRPPPLPPGPPPTPREPYPPAPSVATANQISALGQIVVKKLNDHSDRLDVFHRELSLLRQQTAPNPEGTTNDTMPSPAPVSLPKAIAGHTVNVAKWGTLAIGVLGIAAQIAKVWRPGLVAPLDQVIDLAKQLTGGAP